MKFPWETYKGKVLPFLGVASLLAQTNLVLSATDSDTI